MLIIDLPEDIESRLAVLSLGTGRTRQFYAREAILEYLDDVEERYLAINRIAEDCSYNEIECSDESKGSE